MKHFENITEEDHALLERVRNRIGKPLPLALEEGKTPPVIEAAYVVDDDILFTQCALRWTTGKQYFISLGVTKRTTYATRHDSPDEAAGKRLAFTRAVEAAFNDDLLVL